jgi:uncharacterized protein
MSKFKFSLFRKKNCWRPTLLGWLVILITLIIVFRLSLVQIYNFLAVNKPITSKTLVIEGWVPTYAIKEAVKLYKENNYERLIVTGVPIVNYEFISPYRNTAEATILALKHYGIHDSIYLADIPINIFVDRTYHTAVATKLLFDENNWPKNFNIYSVGVHARRSRLMFRKAFGAEYKIGIFAPRDRTFLPHYWWKSSKGFRNVSNEFVATVFVSLFFHPDYHPSVINIITGRYEDSVYYSRRDKYLKFMDSATSRFNNEERNEFKGFNYYDPDINFKVKAKFTLDTTIAIFGMKTNTDRIPEYRTYGYLDFQINDRSYRLSAFQKIADKDHPEYGKELFVPFKDLTNSQATYGAGRYIDIPIPVSDSIIIDFNASYNPYCAYYDRWSCPLVPFENHLDIGIPAGEKKYKKKNN